MLLEYCNTAISKAEYQRLEDGSWYAEIPGFPGVWSTGETKDGCRAELREVLEEWILLKVRDRDTLPTVDGHSIRISSEEVA